MSDTSRFKTVADVKKVMASNKEGLKGFDKTWDLEAAAAEKPDVLVEAAVLDGALHCLPNEEKTKNYVATIAELAAPALPFS